MTMTEPSQPEFDRAISLETDHRLWESISRSKEGSFAEGSISRLVFPEYFGRGGRSGRVRHRTGNPAPAKLRISEQEARFAFVEAILAQEAQKYFYSIETPTQERYSFQGSPRRVTGEQKGISAQTDLTLRTHRNERILNVEFKSKGASAKKADRGDSLHAPMRIQKDLVKLLFEPVDGMWFHLLEAVDSGTLPKLLEAIGKGLDYEIKHDGGQNPRNAGIPNKTIIIHVCVLRVRAAKTMFERPFSLRKRIQVHHHANCSTQIGVGINPGKSVDDFVLALKNQKGWAIHSHESETLDDCPGFLTKEDK